MLRSTNRRDVILGRTAVAGMRATTGARATTSTVGGCARVRGGRARLCAPRASTAASTSSSASASSSASVALATTAALAALTLACAQPSNAEFYIEDIPEGLRASESASASKRPSLRRLTSGPNGKAIEKCANKCLATCARGGGGGPGLGPASVRRDPVVFKESFRSREYCLYECAEVCSLRLNGGGGGDGGDK